MSWATSSAERSTPVKSQPGLLLVELASEVCFAEVERDAIEARLIGIVCEDDDVSFNLILGSCAFDELLHWSIFKIDPPRGGDRELAVGIESHLVAGETLVVDIVPWRMELILEDSSGSRRSTGDWEIEISLVMSPAWTVMDAERGS